MLDTTTKLDMVTDGTDPDSDAWRCKELWQSVIIRAVLDAAGRCRDSSTARNHAQEQAHVWLSRNGMDFREVCDLAGWDPDFISENYNAGRIDVNLLSTAEHARRIRLGRENADMKKAQEAAA